MKSYTIIESSDKRKDDAMFTVIADNQAGVANFATDYPKAAPGSAITVTGADGTKATIQKRINGEYVEIK